MKKDFLKKKTANIQECFPFEIESLQAEVKNCWQVKKLIEKFLIKIVQDLAERYERTPTYGQFSKEIKISRKIVYGLVFKNYNELLKTAGLKINRNSPKPKEAENEQSLQQREETTEKKSEKNKKRRSKSEKQHKNPTEGRKERFCLP